MKRGWALGELARRAAVSRTTLYQLDRQRIRRPHSGTLGRIAAALSVPPAMLWSEDAELRDERNGPRVCEEASDSLAFDRATNPAVAAVAAEHPELFAGWTGDEWSELYSTFGVGGELTPEGVVATAEAMNRKRQVVRQLQVVLETHLAEVAANMIAALYAMVRVSPSPPDGPETDSRDGR